MPEARTQANGTRMERGVDRTAGRGKASEPTPPLPCDLRQLPNLGVSVFTPAKWG